MPREYLKKATKTAQSGASNVTETVQQILADIEAGGDQAALDYAKKLDNYTGNVILTEDEIEAACAQVPAKLKDDIQFSHDNVRRFAERQKQIRLARSRGMEHIGEGAQGSLAGTSETADAAISDA